jgi:hypothetical protein
MKGLQHPVKADILFADDRILPSRFARCFPGNARSNEKCRGPVKDFAVVCGSYCEQLRCGNL